MNIKSVSALLVLSTLLFGCSKNDDDNNPYAPPILKLNVSYEVDGVPLVFNRPDYQNDAGNPYSVSTLKYFISGIGLIKNDSSTLRLPEVHYIDAATANTNELLISGLEEGTYIGMTFYIGVDPLHNVTGGLPNTSENNAMEWPDMLGGGYHHMKLEGTFQDTSSATSGFTVHLGLNPYLSTANIYAPITVRQGTLSKRLVMNVNEWFRNPYTYDFTVDGAATMNDTSAMRKIAGNGTDVFTLQ